MTYIVSYIYNGKTHYTGPFTTLALAQIEMIKLEAYGMKPSLHER